MTFRINGPGNNLPIPASLYPDYPAISSAIGYQEGNNQLSLAPGSAMLIPAGDWECYVGKYNTLQIYDPILQNWAAYGTTQLRSKPIRSDGINWRVANLTGCPIGASITNAGSGYTSAPTVTASAGSSTWLALIGGLVNTSPTITTAGSGYTIPPILVVNGGKPNGTPYVPATMHATISGGAVTGVTVDNQGAGYASVPNVAVLPHPADPNIANIVPAVITLALTGSGTVSAVLCTFNGSPVANQAACPTLTFSGGGGTGAAATVNCCWMVGSGTASSGTGYPNTSLVTSAGGFAATGSVYTNPIIEAGILSPPRPVQGTATASGGTLSSITIVDGGLFAVGGTSAGNAPLPILAGGAPSAAGTVAFTLASQYSEWYLQPL